MLNFLFTFFSQRFPRLLKLVFLQQKQISTNGKKPSFRFLTVFHISQLKDHQRFRCIGTFSQYKKCNKCGESAKGRKSSEKTL